MARIRTIKPEFWGDEKLSPEPDHVRLVFLAMWSLADDLGRLTDNPRLIDAWTFPGHPDGRLADTHEALMRLARIGRIQRGKTAAGQDIIQIVNWTKHQKIQHPSLKAALPEIVTPQCVNGPHEGLTKVSGESHESFTPHTSTSTNDQNLRPTTDEQKPPRLLRSHEDPTLLPPTLLDIQRRSEARRRLGLPEEVIGERGALEAPAPEESAA